MNAIQLVSLIVRLFALWLAVKTVLEVPVMLNFLSHEKDLSFRIVSLVVSVLSLAFCVYLWRFPGWVSRKIISNDEKSDQRSISSNDFLSIGILLIGVWTVIEALPNLVRQYLFANSTEFADVQMGDSFYAYLYALLFKVILGVWLILGAPGLRNMINWIRSAGVRY